MKQTHDYSTYQEIDRLIDLLSTKQIFEKKTRINLYLPKMIVKLMDLMAKDKSRGDLVSSLVIEKVKNKRKLPYGMFSPLEISEKDIDEITSLWEKAI